MMQGEEEKKQNNLWAAKQGCLFLQNTVTEFTLQYRHLRKQIKKKKAGSRKMLEAKCFYCLKKKKKQGFRFIAECGGEERRSGRRL